MIRFLLRDKAPEGEDIYTIDWKPHIGNDPLTGVPTSQVIESTVEVNGEANDIPNGYTSFWIKGGLKGEVARVRIFAATESGRDLVGEVVLGVR